MIFYSFAAHEKRDLLGKQQGMQTEAAEHELRDPSPSIASEIWPTNGSRCLINPTNSVQDAMPAQRHISNLWNSYTDWRKSRAGYPTESIGTLCKSKSA